MIFISVAHSVGSGANNEKFKLQEYNCSQVMTKACADYLKEKNIPVHVLDVGKVNTQSERKQIKKSEILKYSPKLALEIHLNAAEDKSANYSACFYWGTNQRTKLVSDLIVKNFSVGFAGSIKKHRSIGLPYPGFNLERFWYITENKKCDSIIVEPCFISNDVQAKKLKDESFLTGIGFMVGDAVNNWLKNRSDTIGK